MTLLLDVLPLLALVPAALQVLRREPRRDALFWAAVASAVAGPAGRVAADLAGPWQTGLSAALWATVAVSAILYAGVAALAAQAWRLASPFASYMFLLALVAVVWQAAPGRPLIADPRTGGWIALHIAVSVVTYGLVTIAAVAALAAFVQERALKRRRPTAVTRVLPPLADCEFLVVRLLLVGETVLGIGLVTGMALAFRETGHILPFDHKTVLTLATFVVIAGLLVAHYRTGMRGRRAARMVLLAYLLLTLGYPGVKFVTDVLMA
jgi:ABC-type uncharacterized transport system permease subunit